MNTITLFILTTIIALSYAHNGVGKCPVPTVQQGFIPNKYLGVWYEIYRFDMYFEEQGVCSVYIYITTDYRLQIIL